MKLAVMTLGCPDWTFDEILARAPAMGFSGVDWRGLGGEIDVTRLPEFSLDLARTRARIESAGLATAGVSTSIRLCDAEQFAANLDEAKRTIEACRGLGCQFARVFGGGPDELDSAIENGVRCADAILALEGASEVSWCAETHDQWVDPFRLAKLLDRAPGLGALWDLAHPTRMLGIRPQAVFEAIGSRIRYTHVKDAVRDAGDWRYVAPGEGELPLDEAARIMLEHEYEGWWTFEHEKRWIPQLPPLQVVGPKFVAWAKRVLGAEA